MSILPSQNKEKEYKPDGFLFWRKRSDFTLPKDDMRSIIDFQKAKILKKIEECDKL